MKIHRTSLSLVLVTVLSAFVSANDDSEKLEFFEERIRPVLVTHCYECHSIASAAIEGGLQLDHRNGLMRGGESGLAIVPGKPEESRLIAALKHEALQMPPDKKLPPSIIQDFEHWIAEGAFDPRHTVPSPTESANATWNAKLEERKTWWSLQPLRNPNIPDTIALDGEVTSVDRFISAKLTSTGLRPSPPASPETLLRRISFILTGLPPTPEKVLEFKREYQLSPETAYAKQVDFLLESPHFGERFARRWMDVIHYTDTYGYEWDVAAKGSWEFRDYLIRAFNNDIGFDQLLREHLAGDLLPSPRINHQEGLNESLIGPMFFHLGERRHGSSLDFAGVHQEMIDSQIDAFSKTFLGMTVACARCHDHKLDPVSQSDYYALAGMLMTPRWTTRNIDTPDKYTPQVKRLTQLRDTLRQKIATNWLLHLETVPLDWSLLGSQVSQTSDIESLDYPVSQLLTAIQWSTPRVLSAIAQQPETKLNIEDDGTSILASGSQIPDYDRYEISFETDPGTVSELKLEALTHKSLGMNGPGRTPHGNFVLTHIRVMVTPTGTVDSLNVPIQSARADYEQPNYPVAGALTEAPDGWGVGLGGNVNRSAFFKFAQPVSLPSGGTWKISLDFQLGTGHTLGYFKISTGRSALHTSAGNGELQKKWSEIKELWEAERKRRVEHNRAFIRSDDLTGSSTSLSVVQDGLGLIRGTVPEATPLIALEGDRILSGILPKGYHTHAISPKFSGAIRLPEPESFPKKFVSLKLSGGEWAGFRSIPQNAFLNEGPQFFDPNSRPTWITFSATPLRYGVTRVLSEISTPDLNANFPPRTGVARMGNIVLPNEDSGQKKRGWFSFTDLVAHDSPGTPLDELEPYAALFTSDAPKSNAELKSAFMTWFTSAIQRFANSTSLPGDAKILQWLLDHEIVPNHLDLSPDLKILIEEYRALEKTIEFARTVNSMDERGVQPIDYRLNIRGDVHQEGLPIPRGFLGVFPESSQYERHTTSGRLELAEYLSSGQNPLIGRVYVNRVWQWIFGTGLVETPSDFGKLGGQPSHPELLDWLTLRFMEDGWSTKKLIRRLLLSRTFQQSSLVDSLARDLDPDNRLLHHYPTRRLEAEELRDSILTAAQKLDHSLYGYPIRPFRSAQDPQKRLFSGPLDGLGKRSIYLEMSVMQPPEFLVGFNLPDLKTSMGRRDVTNVPSQALILMNHPFVNEIAKDWGKTLATSTVKNEERVRHMFLAALSRPPSEQETERWLTLARSIAAPHSALETDSNAWSTLALAMFNSKEFLYFR